MTLKEITDALFDGKMVGCTDVGWMWVDPKDGFLVSVADASGIWFQGDDHLVGYLFCSCDNLEVRDNEQQIT